MDAVVLLENISKEYVGFVSHADRILCALTLGLHRGKRRFSALTDINASLTGGQIVGLIGANGAGKSTLLRLLSGISRPDNGRVSFKGSVRAILELGVGFNAELTGFQNIMYNGVLWGYDLHTLKSEAHAILDFAGLSAFADEAMKSYSTGMQMRLAFSLATHRRTDLLLVDEALAVGDAAFQQKCVDRFRRYRDEGSLIVVVSHDMSLLADIADRVILLDHGRLVADGAPATVISEYMHRLAATSFSGGQSGALTGYSVRLLDTAGRDRSAFYCGEEAVLEIALQASQTLEDMTLGFHIHDAKGLRIFGTNTNLMNQAVRVTERLHRFRFQLQLNAGPGAYTLGISLHRGRMHTTDCHLWTDSVLSFELEARPGQISDGAAFFQPLWLGDAGESN